MRQIYCTVHVDIKKSDNFQTRGAPDFSKMPGFVMVIYAVYIKHFFETDNTMVMFYTMFYLADSIM